MQSENLSQNSKSFRGQDQTTINDLINLNNSLPEALLENHNRTNQQQHGSNITPDADDDCNKATFNTSNVTLTSKNFYRKNLYF